MKKRMLRRIISVLSCVVFIGTLFTGCGSSESGGAKGAKILFIETDDEDTFRASLSEAIMSSASTYGVTIDEVLTGDSVAKQVEEVQNAASKGYTGIICRLADVATALQIEDASSLPIVFVNNQPEDNRLKDSKYVYVGSPEADAGTYEAEFVWNKLGKPSSVNLVIMRGEKGHSATEGRTNAARDYFKDQGVAVNIVFSDYANWSTDNAYNYMGIIDKQHASYDAVICNNDSMALGVVDYLDKHGKSDIPVTGVDATADGCASIAAGGMDFTVLQSAKGQGERAVEAISIMANGGSISSVEGVTENGKYVWVPFEKVDASNVSSYQ